MILLKKDTKNLPNIIIDTNILFSALYSKSGNEFMLFEMANNGSCNLLILDHVIMEINRVFEKKSIQKEKLYELFDTFENLTICGLTKISDKEIKLSKDVITDPGDRPIFIFVKRNIDVNNNSFFVSGDEIFFQKKVQTLLKNRVMTTKQAIDFLSK